MEFNRGAARNEDRASAVGTPAYGERGVCERDAGVVWERRVEAEGLVEAVCAVGQFLELCQGGFLAMEGSDVGAETVPDARSFGKVEEEARKETGGRVAAGEEDGKHFVAQSRFGDRSLCEFVKEDVTRLLVCQSIGLVFPFFLGLKVL